MSDVLVAVIGIVCLLALMLLRMPVSFALLLTGFAGSLVVVGSEAAFGLLSANIYEQFSSYGLSVIPLFVFMGQIAFRAGISERLYNAAYRWLGSLPGGLAATVVNMIVRAFTTPIFGVVEIVGFLVVFVNGLALGEAQRTRAHVAVDIAMVRAPNRAQLVVAAAVTLVGVALFGLVTYELVQYGLGVLDSDSTSRSLKVPTWPFPLVLAVGFAGLALSLIRDLITIGRGFRTNDLEGIW